MRQFRLRSGGAGRVLAPRTMVADVMIPSPGLSLWERSSFPDALSDSVANLRNPWTGFAHEVLALFAWIVAYPAPAAPEVPFSQLVALRTR